MEITTNFYSIPGSLSENGKLILLVSLDRNVVSVFMNTVLFWRSLFYSVLKIECNYVDFLYRRATGRLPSERESSSPIVFFREDRWYFIKCICSANKLE